jgi:hypothetical protein
MKTPQPIQQKIYPPSFIDRFMSFVKRLPIPYWLTYLLLFILQSSLTHILAWIDGGWLRAYTFSPILLLFPAWLWGPMAIMTYLNAIALGALASFRPLLEVDEESLARLRYEFTNLPAGGVILSAVMWFIAYVLLTYLTYETFYVAYGLGKLLIVATFVEGLISYCIGGVIYYHSLRQLRLVNRTVKLAKHFNLYQLDPVYAFSRLTSLTGVGWMILLSITLLTYPIQTANAPVLAVLVLQVILALAAFVLPLRVVNRRLVAEKLRLLAELNQRYEKTLAKLHQAVDESEKGEVDWLIKAMTGLNAERSVLTGISTWPWRAGVMTGFLSAIGLPVIFYLIRLAVEKLMGG